jgi:hypothetical protein
MRSALSGTWSYRAYHNEPDLAVPFGELRFATGRLRLEETAFGRIEGRVDGEGWGSWTEWGLDLRGEATYGDPFAIRLRGTATIAGEPWVYDYRAYLMPEWPHGAGGRRMLVGSVIRSTDRASHGAKAGLYAALHAVREGP